MSLPDKWCIYANNENERLIIGNYFNQLFNMAHYTHQENCYYHFPRFDNCCTSSNIQKNYTKITFEDFEKHVLNKNHKQIYYEIY